MARAAVIVVVSMNSSLLRERSFMLIPADGRFTTRSALPSIQRGILRSTLHPPHTNSPRKELLTNGQCTHGSCKDTGSEGHGGCAGGAPFGAGGRSAERGARVPRLSCSPLNQRTRAVPVLRNVRGRRGLRPSPQGVPPCRLPPTSRERRVDGRRRRGGDLSVFHRMTGR